MRSVKGLILLSIIAIALTLSVGYASITTSISQSQKKAPVANLEVKITDVQVTSVTGDAKAGNPSYGNEKVVFNAELDDVSDTVTYTVTLTNVGNVDAVLDNVNFVESSYGRPEIYYSNTNPAILLPAGESTTMTVMAAFDGTYVSNELPTTEVKKSTGTITYVSAK